MKRSTAIFAYKILNNIVVIKDLHNSNDNCKSVTNDVENVIDVIAEDNHGLKGLRVIYCDTDNIYDEILIKNNKFNGFRSLNAGSLKEALIVLSRYYNLNLPPRPK